MDDRARVIAAIRRIERTFGALEYGDEEIDSLLANMTTAVHLILQRHEKLCTKKFQNARAKPRGVR